MSAAAYELGATRAAVDEFLAAAATCAGSWTAPRAPGKWSPAQLAEHVARALEESAKDIQGHPSKFPQLPPPLRLVARHFLFRRVLRTGTFPRTRTNRAMDPKLGPPTVAEARRRMEEAWRALEEAARRVEGRIRSRVFGDVSVSDYLRFQALHTRHHRRQFPAPDVRP